MSADRDIESQQMILFITRRPSPNPSRERWRWIFLTLQACQILTSIADKAKKGGSLAITAVSSGTHGVGVIATGSRGDTNFEVTEIEEVSDTSPQVLIDVHNVGTDESAFGRDTAVSDADRQRKRISQVVKAKDLQSLNDFGGFEGIAVALNTDLEKGIHGDEKDILSRCSMDALFEAQDPAQGFFQLLLKFCNYYIIALLGLSAALSIAFGISMEGLSTGWYQGAIIILATGILVIVSTFRAFWNEKLKLSEAQTIGLFISNLIIVEVFLHFKHGKDKHDFGVPEIKGKPTSIEHIIDVIMGILTKPNGKPSILTTSLALLVLGMVEGVPSLVALAIAYWNKKALSDKSFAKDPLACLSMGSVTTICTDKAGGLKLSSQEVDMCFIGEEVIGEDSMIHADVLETFCNGIGIPVLGQQNPGNSPQDSILSWARLKLGLDIESLRESCAIINELHSGVKGSRVLVRKSKDQESHMCLYWKGPAKAILPLCSLYHDSKGTVKAMDDNKKFIFEQIVGNMQSKNLETLAFAYKKVGAPTFEGNSITLIGMLVLKHICWNETKEATQAFRNAGINMLLISEDDVGMVKDIVDFASKSASTFIMYWHTKLHSPHIGSTGTTQSELASNLQLPLMNLVSTTNP
ncbi:hypothetical protein Pint_09476 [Pistacia integerrima]|uniref:Uncharacterized protein n=1 Tax=Pistacia integerrima TaxID=434235 RepID=A0ACC0XH71_9ROSI|nr:hypothetical protein Pint_09476 [Pistacia integerrima]